MALPEYEFDRAEALTELSQLSGFDPSYSLRYYNTWSDFDGGGWLAVFERDGNYFTCESSYSPEVGDVQEILEYELKSEDQVLGEIGEFEESCAEIMKRQMRTSPSL